jgi:hypothetical protein
MKALRLVFKSLPLFFVILVLGQPLHGEWKVEGWLDEYSGAMVRVVSKQAERPINLGHGLQATPWLHIRAWESKLEVFVFWDTYLGTQEVPVDFYLNNSTSHETQLVSTGKAHEYAFFNEPESMLARMVRGDWLKCRVRPSFRDSLTATFLLDGLKEALRDARKIRRSSLRPR